MLSTAYHEIEIGLVDSRWPMAREKQMVAELKRPKLRKINVSLDVKGDSRAGKTAPTFEFRTGQVSVGQNRLSCFSVRLKHRNNFRAVPFPCDSDDELEFRIRPPH